MAVVIVLTVVGVRGLDLAMKTAPLPAPASRFFRYYDALEQTGETGLWERVLYSWILAGGQGGSGRSPVS